MIALRMFPPDSLISPSLFSPERDRGLSRFPVAPVLLTSDVVEDVGNNSFMVKQILQYISGHMPGNIKVLTEKILKL
jgi:hypothetical protein